MDTFKLMEAITPLLDEAKRYGLEAEVIVFALLSACKGDHEKAWESFQNGFDEWVK